MTMTNEETKARYALVRTDGGDFYVQETDNDGALVALCDSDGETVVEANGSSRIGNVEWTLIRDLGPVTEDGFFDAVAACPELLPAAPSIEDATSGDGSEELPNEGTEEDPTNIFRA